MNETKRSILLKDEQKTTLRKGEVGAASFAWDDEGRYSPGKILALGGCRITFGEEILKEKAQKTQMQSRNENQVQKHGTHSMARVPTGTASILRSIEC